MEWELSPRLFKSDENHLPQECIPTLLWLQEGLRGIYRGFGVACFSIFLWRALYMGGYDAMKNLLQVSSLHIFLDGCQNEQLRMNVYKFIHHTNSCLRSNWHKCWLEILLEFHNGSTCITVFSPLLYLLLSLPLLLK